MKSRTITVSVLAAVVIVARGGCSCSRLPAAMRTRSRADVDDRQGASRGHSRPQNKQLEDLKAHAPQIQADRDRLRSAVPEDARARDLHPAGEPDRDRHRRDVGVGLADANPAPTGRRRDDASRSQVSGDYYQVLDYLNQLESIPRLVVVDQVSLTERDRRGEAGGGAAAHGVVDGTDVHPGATAGRPDPDATTPTSVAGGGGVAAPARTRTASDHEATRSTDRRLARGLGRRSSWRSSSGRSCSPVAETAPRPSEPATVTTVANAPGADGRHRRHDCGPPGRLRIAVPARPRRRTAFVDDAVRPGAYRNPFAPGRLIAGANRRGSRDPPSWRRVERRVGSRLVALRGHARRRRDRRRAARRARALLRRRRQRDRGHRTATTSSVTTSDPAAAPTATTATTAADAGAPATPAAPAPTAPEDDDTDIRTGHARRARQRHPDRSERRPVAGAAFGNRHLARRLHRQRADVRDRDGRRGLLQRRSPATPSPRTIASTRSTAAARSSTTAATPSSSASAPRSRPEATATASNSWRRGAPDPSHRPSSSWKLSSAPADEVARAGRASPILFGCSAS